MFLEFNNNRLRPWIFKKNYFLNNFKRILILPQLPEDLIWHSSMHWRKWKFCVKKNFLHYFSSPLRKKNWTAIYLTDLHNSITYRANMQLLPLLTFPCSFPSLFHPSKPGASLLDRLFSKQMCWLNMGKGKWSEILDKRKL